MSEKRKKNSTKIMKKLFVITPISGNYIYPVTFFDHQLIFLIIIN